MNNFTINRPLLITHFSNLPPPYVPLNLPEVDLHQIDSLYIHVNNTLYCKIIMESDPKIMMKCRFGSQLTVSQSLEQIYRSPVRHGRYTINYQDIESINSTHIYHGSFRTTVCKNVRTRQLRTTHKRKCPLLIHLFQRTKLHLGTRTNTEMKVDRL